MNYNTRMRQIKRSRAKISHPPSSDNNLFKFGIKMRKDEARRIRYG